LFGICDPNIETFNRAGAEKARVVPSAILMPSMTEMALILAVLTVIVKKISSFLVCAIF
jgi:hypothetical protein